ncbi:MAG: DUF177 domain-containing protein [Rhizobiales bacterium]|nr:DUF177 domain-containing protein [Hyphomicrobiales bacterium]
MDKTVNPASAPWSVPVAVEDIPDTGLHVEIEAPAANLVALAELAGIRDLPHLAAVFDLTRQGESVHIVGQVSARVGQNCVVTLEPIESQVEEAVDMWFAPGVKATKTPEGLEPLVGGNVDLGATATEFLILGIDPYPRKSDAKFVPPASEDGRAHPFSGLAALKKRLGGGQS